MGSLGLGLLHAAPARPGPAESARARGCSLAHGPPTLGGSVLQALSLVFYLGFSSQLGLVSPLSLVQLPFPVWFQVESKTRVTAFPECALRSAGLAGTWDSPPRAPCPADLQPWPLCEYGDRRGQRDLGSRPAAAAVNSPRDRGSLPRFPGCTDRETEARGQEGSRPPDGYGYDGAARGSVRHTSLCLWMPVVISGAVCVSVCVCVCVCGRSTSSEVRCLALLVGALSYLGVWGLAQRYSSL